MAGKVILDTNISIGFVESDAAILARMQAIAHFAVPTVALGELYFGAQKSTRKIANVERVNRVRDQSAIIDCDSDTAPIYGEIKNKLRLLGKPIPENDIWIAAIAVQHGLTLVTRDSHFNLIEGLLLEAW